MVTVSSLALDMSVRIKESVYAQTRGAEQGSCNMYDYNERVVSTDGAERYGYVRYQADNGYDVSWDDRDYSFVPVTSIESLTERAVRESTEAAAREAAEYVDSADSPVITYAVESATREVARAYFYGTEDVIRCMARASGQPLGQVDANGAEDFAEYTVSKQHGPYPLSASAVSMHFIAWTAAKQR